MGRPRPSNCEPPVPEVDVEEASALAHSGALMLDVREQDEWDAGHMPAAHHLPLGEIAGADLAEFADRQVVAVCRSGNRSSKAARILAASGIDVVNLAGGMAAWDASGLPVVTDAGDSGEIA